MLKWALVGLAVVVVLVGAAFAALPWLLNTPAFQAWVAHSASQALGRPVRFGSLSISPFPLPTVKLRGLQVAEDPAFGAGPFVTVGQGRIGMRLTPLFSGRVELSALTLDAPRIALVEDARGRWNWASLGAPTSGPGTPSRVGGRIGIASSSALALSRVEIVGGTMSYRKVGVIDSALTLEQVNLTLKQPAPGGALLLSGDALVQPGDIQLKLGDASLTPAAARSFADMALKAAVEVAVTDVGPLGSKLVLSPAMAGALKGRLRVSGTPTQPVASGNLEIPRLTLSEQRSQCEPRRRELELTDLRAPIAYAGASVDSAPIEAKVAHGTVSLQLGILTGSAPAVTVKNINVKGVELGPVLVDFFCQAYAVTGPMDLVGEARFSPADPWRTVNGSGRLRVGRGKVMGREVVTLVREVLALVGAAAAVRTPEQRARPAAPLDFDSITATYTIANGVARTKDLLYQAPDVQVAAAGTVALPDGRVDMKVSLKQGPNEIDGVITGTAAALHVVPTGVRVPDAQGIKKFLDRILR